MNSGLPSILPSGIYVPELPVVTFSRFCICWIFLTLVSLFLGSPSHLTEGPHIITAWAGSEPGSGPFRGIPLGRYVMTIGPDGTKLLSPVSSMAAPPTVLSLLPWATVMGLVVDLLLVLVYAVLTPGCNAHTELSKAVFWTLDALHSVWDILRQSDKFASLAQAHQGELQDARDVAYAKGLEEGRRGEAEQARLLAEARAKHDKLEIKVGQLQSSLDNREQHLRIIRMNQQCETEDSRLLAELRARHEELEREAGRLKASLEEQDAEKKRLQRLADDQDKGNWHARAQRSAAKFSEERTQLQAKYDSLEKANSEISAKLNHQLEEERNGASLLQVKCNQLEKERDEISSKLQQLEEGRIDASSLQAKCDRLEAEKGELGSKLQQLETEAFTRLQQLEGERDQASAKLNELAKDKQEMWEAGRGLLEDHNKLVEANQQLREANQQLREAGQRLEAEHGQLKAEHGQLVHDHRAAFVEHTLLKAKYEELASQPSQQPRRAVSSHVPDPEALLALLPPLPPRHPAMRPPPQPAAMPPPPQPAAMPPPPPSIDAANLAAAQQQQPPQPAARLPPPGRPIARLPRSRRTGARLPLPAQPAATVQPAAAAQPAADVQPAVLYAPPVQPSASSAEGDLFAPMPYDIAARCEASLRGEAEVDQAAIDQLAADLAESSEESEEP